MTIDLGDNIVDKINIFENDDPYLLAKEFCEKHNLTNEAVEILASNI